MNEDLLDFQLSEYIFSTFTPELSEDIQTAFELMYGFELPEPETDFLNLITTDTYNVQDNFIFTLHSKLDYLLKEHHILLNDDATLSLKIQILAGCFAVMFLEDYSFIINILENDATEVEKFSAVISEYSLATEEDIMSNVAEIKPMFLKALSEFAYSKEAELNIDEETLSKEIIENTKLLKEIVGFETVGYLLLKDKVLTGLELESYIGFIDDVENIPNSTVDILTAHILSLILLTKDSLNGVLLTYRKNSHLLVKDTHLVTAVDVKLIELISKLTDYKRVKKEVKNDQS